jgi:outer membrane usher protein
VARAQADPDPGAPPSAEELERVFKQRPRIDRAPVMLVINGVEVAGEGPMLLELARSTQPSLAPSAPIVAALASRLQDDARAAVLAAVHDHHVSIEALRAIGLQVTYDARRLELRIDVPPRLTAVSSHDMSHGGPPDATGALPPSTVSGFVNVRAGGGGTRASQDGSITRAPLYLHSDAAVGVAGWVLEGRAGLAARPEISEISEMDEGGIVHRGDVRLTRDFARQAVRATAGDFGVPAAGLQASFPVLGIDVSRNFALQPYRVVQPIGSFDFVLDRPSSVTVLVNGAAVQTLQLRAGRHDIRDLPLGAGVSDIELLVKDHAGIERRITFSAANPDELLAPGIVQFSLSAGFPLISDLGLRTYDFARPLLSGRYRAGVTPMLTLGGSFDGDLAQQVGGGQLAVATSLGNLSVDAAASRDRTSGYGFAAGARYDYRRTTGGHTNTFAVIGHHYSPGFRELRPQVAEGHYHSDVAISTTRRLPRRLSGRLDLRYQIGREVPDAQSLTFGLGRSFGSFGIDASVSAVRDHRTHDDVRLVVTAHWSLPRQRSSVHAASRVSSAAGVTNAGGYSWHPGSSSGGLASAVRVSEDPQQLGASGSLDYTAYRFTTALAVATVFDREGGGETSQTATFEAATALAFAGGRVAWSRPIAGSFALIERRPVLDGIEVGVNPALDSYAARVDSFGPAVVPSLEPYRVNQLSVDAPDLPAGYSLGPGSYKLLPTYKSGTLIQVGENGTIFLRGTLHGPDGASLAFAIGELVSLDDPQRAPIVLMTNRAGRFGVMGIQAGRYAIRIPGDTPASAALAIPAGTTGTYAAGVVDLQ